MIGRLAILNVGSLVLAACVVVPPPESGGERHCPVLGARREGRRNRLPRDRQNIPCARAAGQPMGSCRFGVRREGGGSGSITVFWPDGGNRVIFFKNGTPSRYDESEADGGARMTVHREVDLFQVRIGDQRFEIPEAVISGG